MVEAVDGEEVVVEDLEEEEVVVVGHPRADQTTDVLCQVMES